MVNSWQAHCLSYNPYERQHYMATQRKIKNTTKAATKQANKAKAAPAKQTAATVTPIADDKQQLAAAFRLAAPSLRNVFQAKFTPLDLSKHTSAKPTDRDEAFIKAIRAVYGTKPFSHKQTGADTGNMARAIHIGYIKATGNTDANGDKLYSAVSNKA
jgi:hypothetical protein